MKNEEKLPYRLCGECSKFEWIGKNNNAEWIGNCLFMDMKCCAEDICKAKLRVDTTERNIAANNKQAFKIKWLRERPKESPDDDNAASQTKRCLTCGHTLISPIDNYCSLKCEREAMENAKRTERI